MHDGITRLRSNLNETFSCRVKPIRRGCAVSLSFDPDALALPNGHFIDGAYVSGGAQTLSVFAPSDGRRLGWTKAAFQGRGPSARKVVAGWKVPAPIWSS